jgi:hypothetical protein
MARPIIEGNKKKIKVVRPLKSPITPTGEFTIREEPVVTVKKSKIPAELADKNIANKKNIAM